TDDSYLLTYKNFLLLLGIGLGGITSLIVIVLIYIFINTNISHPNQPTQLNNFIEKLMGRQLTNVNQNSLVGKSAANRKVYKSNSPITKTTKKQIESQH
ncbi:MAG: serine/threonine-protein kinase, partial [Nostoc sp.]